MRYFWENKGPICQDFSDNFKVANINFILVFSCKGEQRLREQQTAERNKLTYIYGNIFEDTIVESDDH